MYKIETHCHTSPASACGKLPVAEVIRILSEHDYDGVCIANHYTHADCVKKGIDAVLDGIKADFEEAKALESKYNIKVYFGAELRFDENHNDYLLYGFTFDELKELGYVHELRPEGYYKVKPAHTLIYQAHPFRKDMFRADPRFLDGIEVYNGHPGHDSHNDLALAWARENGKKMISGSDFHFEKAAGAAGIMTEVLPENERELARILAAGEFKMITPAWDGTDILV